MALPRQHPTDVAALGRRRTGRPLRVGLLAPPWVPVPPEVYGGTELVIDLLARGLVAAGCEVVLFTTGDTTCPVPRRWLHARALGTLADPREELPHARAGYDALRDVDVVHDHTVVGPGAVGHHELPVITTVHGVLQPPFTERYAAAAAAGVSIIAISHAQRRSAPTVPVAAVIHHGVELDRFPLGPGDGGYVAFLGRMSWDKGVHRAIDIARAAGKRLVIAAKMWEPSEVRYFHEEVEPRLGPDVTVLEPVGGRRKVELLAGAEALVNPIRWPEPFGLVMIEALACGTPVLSFPEGAAPEIVEDGETGFLCADEADMAEKLGAVGRLDRRACRAGAERRFSHTRMVAEHLALYRRLLGDDGAVARPVSTSDAA